VEGTRDDGLSYRGRDYWYIPLHYRCCDTRCALEHPLAVVYSPQHETEIRTKPSTYILVYRHLI